MYTREELYESFPFHEFGMQPEAVFMPQEIGVFPPRATSFTEELEYVVRDVGDDSVDFVTIEDLVGRVARKNYTARRAPLRVVKTKIFVGKEQWRDFKLLQQVFRGMARARTLALGGPGPAGAHGPAATTHTGPLMIEDPETAARAHAEREARLQEREAELARERERHIEAERALARREAEVSARIARDLERIERLMSGLDGVAPQRNEVAGAAPQRNEVASDAPHGAARWTDTPRPTAGASSDSFVL